MAQIFQFGAQFKVIVNFPVENNPCVPIFGENGLVALFEVDDLEAGSAEGKQIGLKDALLVGPAVKQRGGGLPDSFRRCAPVFSGKPGNPAQRSAPLRLTRRLCELFLGISGKCALWKFIWCARLTATQTPLIALVSLQILEAAMDVEIAQNQRATLASVRTSALTPFHIICTPIQTRRNDESRRMMLMPLSPTAAAKRSANP